MGRVNEATTRCRRESGGPWLSSPSTVLCHFPFSFEGSLLPRRTLPPQHHSTLQGLGLALHPFTPKSGARDCHLARRALSGGLNQAGVGREGARRLGLGSKATPRQGENIPDNTASRSGGETKQTVRLKPTNKPHADLGRAGVSYLAGILDLGLNLSKKMTKATE